MWKQLKSFVAGIVKPSGDCLIFAHDSFSVESNGTPTAILGWQRAEYKHTGTPPSNVSVPIWFSYDGPEGHVAVWNEGTIHSTSARGMQTFTSIQALINWMNEGFVYLGWTEDIDGVRVVEEVVAPTPPPSPSPSNISIEIIEKDYVYTGAGKASSKLAGNVLVGQKYGPVQIMTNGWALITFTGKKGYIEPSSFKRI